MDKNNNKEIWKKWWFWLIIAIILVVPFIESENTEENNIIEDNNISTSNEIVQTEKSELSSELFGDLADKKNYFFDAEKTIRKFVLEYNEKANVKVTNVEWVKNHSIADVKFNNMSARLNSSAENGFLCEFEFTNGKKMIDEYKKLIKDIVYVFDSTVKEEVFDKAFNNAKVNENKEIKITENIIIKMHYNKEQVGFLSGDRYFIDITCGNYDK